MQRVYAFLFLAIPLFSWGQVAPKYSNAFLGIGVDARSMAMGNSVVSLVGDATASYWNPAGLARVDKYDFSLMHAEYFAGVAQYDYLGAAMPLDKGAIGISFIRFGVDNILNTTRLIDENGNVDYDRITRFSAADYALMVSHGREVGFLENLTLGGSLKLVYRNIGPFANAYGIGLDAGAQYKIGKWQFGATIWDVTTTTNGWVFDNTELEDVFEQTGNELPENGVEITIPRLQVGASRKFDFNDRYSLLTSMEFETTFDGQRNAIVSSPVVAVSPMAGVEFSYDDFVFVRTGFNQFQRELTIENRERVAFQPNLGIGFKYMGISLDYALTNIGGAGVAIYSNIFSLKVQFAKKG